jgi:hypothetical protein
VPGRDLEADDHPALAPERSGWRGRLRWRRTPALPAVLLALDLGAVGVWLLVR